MEKKQEIISKFKKGLIAFLDELIEQFPQEQDFYLARIFIKDTIPIMDIITYFIKFVLPYKDLIMKRDKKIIIEKIFSILNGHGIKNNLSGDKINKYNKIFDALTEENRNTVFTWAIFFIDQISEYKSLN